MIDLSNFYHLSLDGAQPLCCHQLFAAKSQASLYVLHRPRPSCGVLANHLLNDRINKSEFRGGILNALVAAPMRHLVREELVQYKTEREYVGRNSNFFAFTSLLRCCVLKVRQPHTMCGLDLSDELFGTETCYTEICYCKGRWGPFGQYIFWLQVAMDSPQ